MHRKHQNLILKIKYVKWFVPGTNFMFPVLHQEKIYGEKNDFSYIGWAGGVILFAGLFDMLDGQVARIGKIWRKKEN